MGWGETGGRVQTEEAIMVSVVLLKDRGQGLLQVRIIHSQGWVRNPGEGGEAAVFFLSFFSLRQT